MLEDSRVFFWEGCEQFCVGDYDMRFWKIVVMVAETCGVTDASSTQIGVMGEGA